MDGGSTKQNLSAWKIRKGACIAKEERMRGKLMEVPKPSSGVW